MKSCRWASIWRQFAKAETRIHRRASSVARRPVHVTLAAALIIAATAGSPIATDTAAAASSTVAIYPGSTIQSVVNIYPAGTTFVIKPGTHRKQSVVPRNGDVYLGEPGAVMNGSELLTSFQQSGSVWIANVQVAKRTPRGVCDSTHPACALPEDLFINDAPLVRVLSQGAVGPGLWYLDYTNGRVYIGSDPRGRKVELSVTPYAFSGSAQYVTIRGLTIEKYASMAGDGAVHGQQGMGPISHGWKVLHNEIRFNHGAGVRIGDWMVVANNHIHHNGQLGVAGGATNAKVEVNDISFNNVAGYYHGWEAGGAKFANIRNLLLRKNYVHDNNGPGLWCDIGSWGITYEYNRTARNKVAGIFHEISYYAVIRYNTVEDDGFSYPGQPTTIWYGAGILISNSSEVQVYGNTVTNSMNGIGGIMVNRGNGANGQPYLLKNLSVHSNTITQSTGFAAGIVRAPTLDNSVYTSWNNHFQNDTHVLSQYNGKYFVWYAQLQTKSWWDAYLNLH